MKIQNTTDPQLKPSLVMMCYGEGGVGKTTFGSTAPKPILLDFENGSKYFGLRGISLDVVNVQSWNEIENSKVEIANILKGNKYETIIVDPIGEAMDKLKRYMIETKQSKLVQSDGSPTMAGWGWMKKRMREFVNWLRTSGKNVIIIAHLAEEKDEDRIVKRPKIETKLSDDLVNMVDVVGYMTVINDNGAEKRVIIVDPSNDKYTAKDRTGQLGKIIEPDFAKIVDACNGTKTFAWSKTQAKKEVVRPEQLNQVNLEAIKVAKAKLAQAKSMK